MTYLPTNLLSLLPGVGVMEEYGVEGRQRYKNPNKIDLKSMPTTTTKYLSLYPQISVVLTHQGNFSLQQMEIITENHSQLKC